MLKYDEIFESFEIYNIFMKFLNFRKKKLAFFAIWLTDWKWNLVSGWTTLKHWIDNRQK